MKRSLQYSLSKLINANDRIIQLMGPYVYRFWSEERKGFLRSVMKTHINHEQALVANMEASGYQFTSPSSNQIYDHISMNKEKKEIEKEWQTMLLHIRRELRARLLDLSVPPSLRKLFRTQYFDIYRVYASDSKLIFI